MPPAAEQWMLRTAGIKAFPKQAPLCASVYDPWVPHETVAFEKIQWKQTKESSFLAFVVQLQVAACKRQPHSVLSNVHFE